MEEKRWEKLKANFPVLVVEDNQIARKLLERKLHLAGYKVKSTSNGREALKAFDERFYPIMLTDWMMPEMNGLELCKTIREKDNEGYVFMVLLTARDSKEDIIEGLEAGADDYLTKPVNHAELIARLNSGMRILELERSLKEANERIKILSVTDPLTGCFNRGYMSKKLIQEMRRAERYNHPISVIFCDIDHFKSVNDTYGHLAGDQVLKDFSRCLMDSIRVDVDWLTRYGGEEFLIVLPETQPEGAAHVAERIRQSIEEQEIVYQKQKINITSSFGVVGLDAFPKDSELSVDTLIARADDALYKSKRDGRNRVTVLPL